jgi:hypothetical protein
MPNGVVPFNESYDPGFWANGSMIWVVINRKGSTVHVKSKVFINDWNSFSICIIHKVPVSSWYNPLISLKVRLPYTGVQHKARVWGVQHKARVESERELYSKRPGYEMYSSVLFKMMCTWARHITRPECEVYVQHKARLAGVQHKTKVWGTVYICTVPGKRICARCKTRAWGGLRV